MGGGLGHGVRSLAVARRLRHEVRVWAPARLKPFADLYEVPLDSPAEDPRPTRETLRDWVGQRLEEFSPDFLVVDVFPRGVLGEIPPGGPPRFLVTRHVRNGFYEAAGPARGLQEYLALLACELPAEALRHDPRLKRTAPITLAPDLLPRDEARKALKAESERPLVLVLGTGPWQYHVPAALRDSGCTVRLAGALGLLPASAFLLGADAVVAAGGYNSYYEVARSGVPAVFLPQDRPVDDQAARVRGGLGPAPSGPVRIAAGPEDLPRALAEVLQEPPGPVQAWDGAAEVAAWLNAC